MAESSVKAVRMSAFYALAPVLNTRPHATLTAEQQEAVRAWRSDCRKKRRQEAGDALKTYRKSQNTYYQEHKAERLAYQRAYQAAHREENRLNVARWRAANPERAALHQARFVAKRRGHRQPSLGEGFATRITRQKDVDETKGQVRLLAEFLAEGEKSCDECMQRLLIQNAGEWEAFMEVATELLPTLWEDNDGNLGLA